MVTSIGDARDRRSAATTETTIRVSRKMKLVNAAAAGELYCLIVRDCSGMLHVEAAKRIAPRRSLAGVRTYVYDAASRQTGVAYPSGKALTYGYDAVGSRAWMLDPDGGYTTYGYDAGNRLIGIANPYSEMTTIAYDPLGREQVKVLGNGVQVSHSYDAAGRETWLAQFDPLGVALAMYTGIYDAVGNRTGVVELDGTLVTYGYDASDQLTLEERSGVNAYATRYTYDGAGNRTLQGDSGQFTDYQYNAANELVLVAPPTGQPTTVGYDSNGNQALENAGGQLTSYVWDFENRLTGVAYPAGTNDTYAYSSDGMRQQKVTSAGEVDFVWDGVNVLLETDAAGATQAHYTDYPGMWGGLVSQNRAGNSSFYGTDLQASVRMLLSQAAAVTDQYLYRAFGEELWATGSTVNPFRYVGGYGYYRDLATRLDVRRRPLDVVNGIWLSRDPMQAPGALSWYLYASQRPITSIDPSGRLDIGPFHIHWPWPPRPGDEIAEKLQRECEAAMNFIEQVLNLLPEAIRKQIEDKVKGLNENACILFCAGKTDPNTTCGREYVNAGLVWLSKVPGIGAYATLVQNIASFSDSSFALGHQLGHPKTIADCLGYIAHAYARSKCGGDVSATNCHECCDINFDGSVANNCVNMCAYYQKLLGG